MAHQHGYRTISLPEDLHKVLRVEAATAGISMMELVRQAMALWRAQKTPEDGENKKGHKAQKEG